MRIAILGNGSLGSPGAVVRDGTVADRLALFDALEAQGIEVVYVAPPERSPGDTRVVNYPDLEGDLDALILEVRDAVWPPSVKCLLNASEQCSLEHDGYDLCVHEALTKATGIPVYWQAWVLRRWADGAYGDPPVYLWDFDLNARRVFGLAGRESTYVLGKFWRKAVPWMEEVLEKWRMDERSRVLVPYDPYQSPLTIKQGKKREERYKVVRFYWCYPEWLEVDLQTAPDLGDRRWSMVYTGSDYDRRRRWDAFYGEYMRRYDQSMGVAVSGTWGNRRRGRDREPWNENGYRDRLVSEFGDKLTFLSPSSTTQLPFMEVMEHLTNARMAVQVVPDEYASIGYYTNRIAEAAARATPLAIDREIHEAELWGPTAKDLDQVFAWYARDVQGDWKGHIEERRVKLKTQVGAARQAQRLTDIVRGRAE